MLFAVDYEKESNRGNSKDDECARSNPMSNSLRIPVLDAVTEGESYKSHTDKAEHTKNVEEFASDAKFIIHIARIQQNTTRGEDTPEPEKGLSLSSFAKKRESTKLRCGIIAPEEGKGKSVDEGTKECAYAKGFKCL